MHIVIFGTGGVGGYFGARLAQAGETVTFIARGAHLDAMQQNGLHIKSIKGNITINPIQATDDPFSVGKADFIFCTVKAWQVPEAAKAMRPMVGDDTVIVPLLNGVEATTQLAKVVGSERVMGGLCWILSTIERPGVIHHSGLEPQIIFGELDNRRSQRIERLYQICDYAKIQVEIPHDIVASLWEKFIYIAAISGMAAITRSPVGIIRTIPQTRQMIEHAIDEIIAVGWEKRVNLAEDVFARTLAFIDSMPPSSTLSMQRDIMQGRPSELEAQNGAVVRFGKEVNVTTSINAFIYHSLLPMELMARGLVQVDQQGHTT